MGGFWHETFTQAGTFSGPALGVPRQLFGVSLVALFLPALAVKRERRAQ